MFGKNKKKLTNWWLTEKEARDITLKAKEVAMTPIYTQIREAAEKGLAEVFLYNNRIPSEQQRHLEDNGFKVHISCGIKDGTGIAWENWKYSKEGK